MKRVRLLIVTAMLLFGIGGTALLGVPVVAADTPQSVVCTTLNSDSACGTTPKNSLDVNQAIAAVVNILSTIIGIAAVIMIIVGGFRYITSNGDSGKISSARSTIVYALVGVV